MKYRVRIQPLSYQWGNDFDNLRVSLPFGAGAASSKRVLRGMYGKEFISHGARCLRQESRNLGQRVSRFARGDGWPEQATLPQPVNGDSVFPAASPRCLGATQGDTSGELLPGKSRICAAASTVPAGALVVDGLFCMGLAYTHPHQRQRTTPCSAVFYCKEIPH